MSYVYFSTASKSLTNKLPFIYALRRPFNPCLRRKRKCSDISFSAFYAASCEPIYPANSEITCIASAARVRDEEGVRWPEKLLLTLFPPPEHASKRFSTNYGRQVAYTIWDCRLVFLACSKFRADTPNFILELSPLSHPPTNMSFNLKRFSQCWKARMSNGCCRHRVTASADRIKASSPLRTESFSFVKEMPLSTPTPPLISWD